MKNIANASNLCVNDLSIMGKGIVPKFLFIKIDKFRHIKLVK